MESQDKTCRLYSKKNVELLEIFKEGKYNEKIYQRNYTLAEGAEWAKKGCRGPGKKPLLDLNVSVW